MRSTGLLGDWYATLLTTRPQWLLLLVSASTRLPLVMPAAPLATIAPRLTVALTRMLLDLYIDASAIARELATMAEVRVTTTQSRSVLGTINDFSDAAMWILHDEPTMTLQQLSRELAQTPVRPIDDSPDRATQRLFWEQPVA